MYMVLKNSSLCLLQTLTSIILGMAKYNGLKYFGDINAKFFVSNLLPCQGATWTWAEDQNSNILIK